MQLAEKEACRPLEVVDSFLSGHLRLGWSPALAASLLMLDDGHGSWDELDTPVAAVGASMQLAVVVQVVLTVELVLAAELTGELVRSLSMETMMSKLVMWNDY